MPSSLVELRPNRRFLDHEFEGYKLNLQALPHYSHDLEVPADRLFPDEVQYSFVHAKLFALHNHLVADYWDYSYNFYYIDKKQQVRRISFNSNNHTFENTVVYDVPAHVERKSGHFNLYLDFPSSNIAVVSDGTGYLHIVDTGSRNATTCINSSWHTAHSELVLGEEKYFIIVNSRIQEKNEIECLHCLLQSVEQNDSRFFSVLTWVTYERDGSNWKQVSMKQLQGKGIVHYAAIESSCDAIYVASDNPFKFTSDSEHKIVEKTKEEKKTRKIVYNWYQSMEDVSVTMKLGEKHNKNLLRVEVTPLAIKVSYAGNVFIEGKLRRRVDSELTTWNVQKSGQVDILLTKTDALLWDNLLEAGDPDGEEIMNTALCEEAHRRLAHLCSETEVTDKSVPTLSTQQLEECDAASEEDAVLVRFNSETREITHRLPLMIYEYLFNIRLETNEVPAIALRQDVDCCIWQPYAQLVNSDTWPIKHQGTLLAFGYVLCSKTNRKFVTCPPNFSYGVVCEATKHIFIYQGTGNENSQLRKRTEGVMKNVKIGQQHVFNIDKFGEVLGVHATNDYLFVLTEKSMVTIGIE